MQKNFPTKVSVPIKVFWYSDRIVWPKTVTIITLTLVGTCRHLAFAE